MTFTVIERIITGLLLIIAIIHILPISGFFSIDRLTVLYDIKVDENNLEILMRHRAILFGLLGFFIAYAAFNPSLQPLAFIATLGSVGSFFYLAFSIGDYNAAIQRIVIADVIAAICLVIAVILWFVIK
ncbi:MAG: phosphopantetheine adenylyltransferase [Anaerolineae bacterium]